jgi:hypothetical protein
MFINKYKILTINNSNDRGDGLVAPLSAVQQAGHTAIPAVQQAGHTATPAVQQAGHTATPAVQQAGHTTTPAVQQAGHTTTPAVQQAGHTTTLSDPLNVGKITFLLPALLSDVSTQVPGAKLQAVTMCLMGCVGPVAASRGWTLLILADCPSKGLNLSPTHPSVAPNN